jgi:cobalt/nickel transport system permease protein
MHLSDPFLSVPVGLGFCVISAVSLSRVGKTLERDPDSSLVPLTGVMAAFVFAAQMVNFAIPGTGSSGHLSGGLLLAYLLGSRRAFLAMSSVLVVQCLFFADGGILALGCNVFNLGFIPAFVVYPIAQRFTLAHHKFSALPIILGGMVSLVLGAIMVGLQIGLSERTGVSMSTLLTFLVPIHWAIGIVEGFASWGILAFLLQARPHLVPSLPAQANPNLRIILGLATVVVAGLGCLFASTSPDGLEWSLERVKAAPVGHAWQTFMDRVALFADYSFPSWVPLANHAPMASTSASGLIGSVLVLALAVGLGVLVRRSSKSP